MESFGKNLGAGVGAKVVSLKAAGSITAKRAVAFNTAGGTDPNSIVQCTNVLQPIGIALETASTGDIIAVLVKGKVSDATTDGSVAGGETLVADTNGYVTPYANTSVFLPFALALEGDASGTAADLWVMGVGAEVLGL